VMSKGSPVPPSEKLWPKFLSGGLATSIMSAVLNPMDVIKVRLQLQNQLAKIPTGGFHLKESPYHGFFHAGKKIYLEEGYFRGLMKGFTPSMIREFSYSSIRMGLYDPVKKLVAGPKAKVKDDITLIQKIIAGALCGAMGSALVTPTDVVKIRFQSITPGQERPYKNTFDAFRKIYQNEGGLKGLYKGMGVTTLRASVLTAAQLPSYDHTKRVLLRNGYMDDNVYCHVFASFVCGLVTTTATNPVDIVKTRWMTDKSRYKNPLDCFMKIILKEGPHAVFKGWLPNYLRFGPHFIISLPLYDFFRTLFGVDTL